MYKGVAQFLGKIKVRGFPAWVMHRSYHVMAMPTLNRKLAIMSGWTANLLWRRETVALGSIHDPRAEFRAASVPPKPKPEAAPAAAPATAEDHSPVPSSEVKPSGAGKADDTSAADSASAKSTA
jgi:NADH dehydrogenase